MIGAYKRGARDLEIAGEVDWKPDWVDDVSNP
jgi:hypothetical protein